MSRVFAFFTDLKDKNDGAVTVDWVILTALLAGIATAVLSYIGPPLHAGAGVISVVIVETTDG